MTNRGGEFEIYRTLNPIFTNKNCL